MKYKHFEIAGHHWHASAWCQTSGLFFGAWIELNKDLHGGAIRFGPFGISFWHGSAQGYQNPGVHILSQ